MEKVVNSMQDRIDRLAIAYVQSHYDVKSMTVTDFVKAVADVQYEIAAYLGVSDNR